jgi:hypothetical protein
MTHYLFPTNQLQLIALSYRSSRVELTADFGRYARKAC